MSPRLAAVISAISSPFLVLPVFGLWVISAESINHPSGWLWGILFVVVGMLPPAAYILIGVRHGHLTDLHVAKREQRATPFAIATIGTALLFGTYLALGAPPELVALSACMGICGLIFYAISTYWKISIHAASYTGSVFIVGLLLDPRFFWLLLGLPIIFWARLTRNRHTLEQGVAASAVVAICITAVLRLTLG